MCCCILRLKLLCCVCVCSVCRSMLFALNVCRMVFKTTLRVHHFVSRFSEVQNRREPFHEALRSWQPLWGRWVTASLQICYRDKDTLQILNSHNNISTEPSNHQRMAQRLIVSFNRGWDFLNTCFCVCTQKHVFTKYLLFLVTFNLYPTKKSFVLDWFVLIFFCHKQPTHDTYVQIFTNTHTPYEEKKRKTKDTNLLWAQI